MVRNQRMFETEFVKELLPKFPRSVERERHRKTVFSGELQPLETSEKSYPVENVFDEPVTLLVPILRFAGAPGIFLRYRATGARGTSLLGETVHVIT